VGAVVATAWYLMIQTQLFRQALELTRTRALLLALWAFGSALLYVLAIALVVALGL
jgi:hypothetical protein